MGTHHSDFPISDGYVAIEWSRIGNLKALGNDRESYKNALKGAYPEKKPGAIPVDAGTLFRFANEMEIGDFVVYPSKVDKRINIGQIQSDYAYVPPDNLATEVKHSCHRRKVSWLANVPRAVFSQSALYEIGSFISVFQISTHKSQFFGALEKGLFEDNDLQVEESDSGDIEAAAEQVEETTEDFVLRRLKASMSPDRFEHFTAHLLECMGYYARVTQYSSDGGIDVIAHRDELGLEPPIIKVQCKQTLNKIGRPDVQQLLGAVEQQEVGLFVTLGQYSREALDLERTRPNLRLIDGATLVDFIFGHYSKFEPQWQTILPLKKRYIPGVVKQIQAD